ncbi:class I SAM-dependent methyltransferase [uncultured Cellulomonas sp.]|uniref:class I SAM-dependent methyltransferase n=1 Tax=uncultured Cellulomonas sp. TaxID=189682 RepID=UPI0026068AB2|nr:class I SAM-dependent methyltransferase [uncultured Cellulomonas sp.]
MTINDDPDLIDETARATGLAQLRRQNNATVVERIRSWGAPDGARLLDVGSAHGWLLQRATAQGLRAVGVEPDVAVARRAIGAGSDVRIGFFPEALRPDDLFDVITFNDVLEHLPDPREALAESASRLTPGGLLVVNIPDRRGIVYRVADVLRRLGVPSVFDRLWQRGLPSPHLWYFDAGALTRLGCSLGLEVVEVTHLPSMSRAGLWERAHFDRRPSPVTVASVVVGWLAAPLLNSRSLSDIMLVAFRKPSGV